MTRKLYLLLLVCLSIPVAGMGQLPLDTSFNILSPRFFPGWQAQNVCYPYVIYDNATGHYKMYYAGSSSSQVNESLWDQWVIGVVTSKNTVNWTYPDNYEQVLFARKFMQGDVVDPNEQAGIFDSVFAIDACVLKDGSTYKCWYTGWNGQIEHTGGGLSRKINFRIGYATSPNGLSWTKSAGTAGAGSVLGLGGVDEPDAYGVADPCVLKENGTYRMWYAGYDGNSWQIHYATSIDGVNWTKEGVVLSPGNRGELDELGIQNPVVITRAGQYELWYQGQSTSSPHYHVMRAVSPDGISWSKIGEVALHPVVPEPSWPWSSLSLTGSEKIVLGNILVQPDNSCQIFYAKQYTAQKDAEYAVLSAPLFYLYTERINP